MTVGTLSLLLSAPQCLQECLITVVIQIISHKCQMISVTSRQSTDTNVTDSWRWWR